MIEICKSQGKENGGPWKCYDVYNFFGWEAQRKVVVTTGGNILEMATRARTELFLLLAEPEKEEFKKSYRKFPVVIKAAEDEGLVDV